ncbi:MAG: tRNA (adenosine(37)-N6)-threonylcarbamoyltransferase complex ATPase subunit type 1 TsaE [Oscillospiraceae bacterium]|nr:tRNA (adenosine(37)-N6)-threonylcarbamoyltransferase complex ATPase subunit type 1 TsaE [Oscillospiraceae bacterium]
MQYHTFSEAETTRRGAEFVKQLKPGAVVAFYGDLGAGKTAFIRGMVRGLGLDDYVTSPTFTIVNEYLGPVPVFHFDMYRLAGADELFDIGWEDYIAREGICCVEWSENVEGAFPEDTVRVSIRKLSESERLIDIDMPEVAK